MTELSKIVKYGLITVCTLGAAIGLYSFSAALIAGLRPKVNRPVEEVSPETTYPVRIQYQTVAGNVIKVGAQRIHYASSDSVARSMGPTQKAHLENVKLLETTIASSNVAIAKLEDELSEARNTAADTYDKTVEETTTTLPKANTSGKDRFRNMLANSSGYEQADNNTLVVVTETIGPLKQNIRDWEQKRLAANQELFQSRNALPDKLFAALPSSPKFITTDEDGHADLTLPSVTRSYCWADFTKVLPNGQEERLRWLVLVPDEIDANGTIIMSHDNVYSADSITALPNPNNTLENRNIGNR